MLLLRNHFCNFGTPEQCNEVRNTSFVSFHMPKVSEMLQNTPKHNFGFNGVEWMHLVRNHFHNFGTPKQCIQARTTVLHLFTCRMFPKCSKHSQTSFWVQWSRTDAFGAKPFSQLRYPEIVHLSPKLKFCIFLHAEGFQNAPIHSQTSFWVQWSRMNAFIVKPFSQLRYPGIVQ